MKKITFLVLFCSITAFAQLGTDTFTIATDDTVNYSTWSNGDNGGSGFGNWVFTLNGTAGHYFGASGEGDPSFAVYSDGGGNYADAQRSFNAVLKKGDKFEVNLGHSVTINGEIFIQFLDDGIPVFTLKFVSGDTVWRMNDGGSDFDSGMTYLANQSLPFSFTYNEDGTFSYTFGFL